MAQHIDIADLLQGLPTLPAIPVQIMRRMDDPLGCDLREIARLAERDPIVSAQLLRLANSALFGGLGRTETVIDAVVRLGLSDTRKIVLTIALVETFPESADSFDVRRFWTFSLASALCADVLREWSFPNLIVDAVEHQRRPADPPSTAVSCTRPRRL